MTVQPNCPKCGELMDDFFDDGVRKWECPVCDEELEAYLDREQCPSCGSELIVWDEMEEADRCEICDYMF
ncbi:MAG: hypothetical protein RMY16_08380 [Nostoc sp. DedQUE12b]|uniref:hypothetical protein n=1 Tax=Nostoc sp. DedQUE12b TaxID=3075398 RepID=UPI002AD47A4F|nr:hypothetical protein [Nostoc sp. DedQUE12b]MDZ8085598.1 hypothetical protein [Nostoc sp. DedQUE12b]